MMRAAVYTKRFTIELQEMPIPKPEQDEIVLKVLGCGVCGTDQHIYAGEVPLARPPVVLGHEYVGEIVELGKEVTGFNLGDWICVDPLSPCGYCPNCQDGSYNHCSNIIINGYHITGGFAQYSKINRKQAYPISKELGVKAGIIAEPLACVLHGYDLLHLRAGSNILLLGAGPIGLLWTQLLNHSPVKQIVQVELIESRGQFAKKYGADIVFNPSDKKIWHEIKQEFPQGFEYVVDVTGNPEAVAEGLKLVKRCGTLMIFGVCPEEARVTFSPYEMFANEITILGAKMPPYTMSRAIALLESGKIDYNGIVSHIMPLNELAHAFDMFVNQKEKILKMAIDPYL
ncbi:MAG: zinc-dependent alcohol dehydrogenase family protein [bacterium]|nr:zinc-dependent alcohol dehydrogenase family protein [bacterium]